VFLGSILESGDISIYCQVAAFFPEMFCKFYLVKDHKIANNSATTEAREKISNYLEFLEFFQKF
jgi:hypothetical protein